MTNCAKLCKSGQFGTGRSPICTFFALFVLVSVSAANAGMAERLAGYVDACRVSILSGDVAGFADLAIETETLTETVSVLGWRDLEEGSLTVSLLRRGNSAGVCDVAYRPLGPSSKDIADLDAMRENLAREELRKEPSKVELVQAGQVILTCDQGRGMALYLDPTAQGIGFAAQVATVPTHRMRCEG